MRAQRASTGESGDTLTRGTTGSPGGKVLGREREARPQLLFSGTNILQISADIDLVFLSETFRSPSEFSFRANG